MKPSFLKSFGQLFFLSTLSYVIGFLGQIIISYYLGTSSSLDTYFTILAAAGFLLFYISPIRDALVKVVYDANFNSSIVASRLFSSGLIMQVLLSILSSMLFFIKPFWVLLGTRHDNTIDYTLLLFFVPYLSLFALSETTNGLLLSFNKLQYQAIARLISSVIGLIFVVALAKDYGIYSLILSLQITQLATAVISTIGLRKNGIKIVWASPRYIVFAPGFWPILSSLLLSYFFSQIYVLVERSTMYRMTKGLVASYQYSATLVNVGISMIVLPVTNLIWPRFLEEHRKGNEANIIKLTENTIVGMCFLLAVGCLFVYINAYDIITLIYSRGKFDNNSIISTGKALQATIFTAIPIGIYGILTKVLITRGYAKHLALAASSIAFFGIGVIILAYFINSTTLVMWHWVLGNTIGALFSFYSVKKYLKPLFSKSRYWGWLSIRIIITISVAVKISSLPILGHIFGSLWLSIAIKFTVYMALISGQFYLYKLNQMLKSN